MVRTGPRSKLAEVETAIQEMLLSSHARAHGMGFREIHRNLQTKPKASRAGSFATLSKCLHNLEADKVLRKSTTTKKYFIDEIGFAHYDRDLIIEAILKSNVLGGGRLFQPKFEIRGDRIILPEKKPEVFAAVDVFIKANIKGIYGWPDEGVQFIETLEGAWPEKHPEAHGKPKGTRRIGREPLHFEKLVVRRLNANRTARSWIQAIWDYARENRLVDYDLPLDKASNKELEKIWKEIFGNTHVETVVLTEFIEPKKLFKWWTELKQERS